MPILSEPDRSGPQNTPKRRVLKRLFLTSLPILVLVLAFYGVNVMSRFKPVPESKTEAPRATPVITARAEVKSAILSVKSQGEVRALTETDLGARVGGQIIWVSPDFVEGGHVRKGQVLLRLDPADYALRVTQAQASVAQAQTVLTREISESEIAKKDWEDLGQGPASDLTLRKPQMAEAKARIAATRAALDEARLQLKRTRITAPFTGRILQKKVALGDTLAPGQNVARLFAVDTVEIKLPLTDSDLARLGLGVGFRSDAQHPGPKVELTAKISGRLHHWTGELVRTASSFDPKSRLLFAYVNVRDPYGQGADQGVPLAPGLFVQASIKGQKVDNSIIIPRAGLRGKDKVYLARDDGTLSIRPVTVRATSRESVVISSGLTGGENVIISPIRGVADGMRIERADTQRNDTESLGEDGQ